MCGRGRPHDSRPGGRRYIMPALHYAGDPFLTLQIQAVTALVAPFQNIDLFTDSLAWMGGTPCGNPLLDRVQLFGGDVGSDQLAVGGVLLLILPLDGGGQVKPEVGLNIVVRNALADGVEHAERGLRGCVSLLRSFAVTLARPNS